MISKDKNVLCFAFGGFIALFGFGFVVPFLPLHASNLGATYFEIGLLLTAVELTTALAGVPLGLLADKYGRKMFASAGFALFSLMPLAYAFAWSPWSLIGMRCIQGVSEALFFTIGTAYIAEIARRKGSAIGAYNALTNIGLVPSPIIGGMLIPIFGIQKIFFLGAMIIFIGFLISLTAKRDVPSPKRERPFKFQIIKDKKIYILSLIGVFSAVTIGFTMAFLQIFFHELASSDSVVGYATAVYFFGFSVSMFLAGHVSDIIGRWIPSIFGFILGGIGFFCLSLSGGIFLAGISIFMVGIGQSFASVPITTKIADISSGGTGGSLGISSMFRLLAVALSAALGGVLARCIGIDAVFMLCGVVMLAGSVAAILVKRSIEKRSDNTRRAHPTAKLRGIR